jgi:hypothetical protein
MPPHWTYADFEPTAELEQGDILQSTEPLRKVFGEVHPHFRQEKYLGFLVATQSCDLVRHGEFPKASYINLAAIRSLSQVINKVLAEVVTPAAAGVFPISGKGDAHRLLERVLNQNEQAIGLFFLHTDLDRARIAEPAVAFLRITVALRAEHYEILRAARVGRLTPEFRAKLGWLLGNLYARPATPDWTDKVDGKKAFDALISQYISEAKWIDDEILQRAKTEQVDVTLATQEALEGLRPPSRLERALSEVEFEMRRVVPPETPSEVVTKLTNRLKNNAKFRKLLK